jgi:phosphoribosylformimino-5-aminoimidazole carboxamide ribotide isomerase
MLIPSIDLRGGRVVQLVQGERLALETDDLDGWIGRFRACPKVQVIDLDAALGTGENHAIVSRLCRELPCRVGGGIRTLERAEAVLAGGATEVIVGSALFDRRTGHVDAAFAARLANHVGSARVIAAIDSRDGRVVVGGWRMATALTAADAARALEPYCSEFLYTHVETEGLMQGIDLAAVAAVRAATSRRLTVAGGVATRDEVDRLHALGIDAVVGMAIYTGRLRLDG